MQGVTADPGESLDWGVQDAPFKMLLLVNQELFDANGKPKKMTAGKVWSFLWLLSAFVRSFYPCTENCRDKETRNTAQHSTLPAFH